MDWPQVSAAVADTSEPLPDTLSPSLYRLFTAFHSIYAPLPCLLFDNHSFI